MQIDNILKKHLESHKEVIVDTRVNVIPIILDHSLRWVALYLLKIKAIGAELSFLIQFAIIPIFILWLINFINKKVNNKIKGKIKNIYVTASPSNFANGILGTILVASLIGIGVFFQVFITAWLPKIILHVFVFALGVVYFSTIFYLSNSFKIIEIFINTEEKRKINIDLEIFNELNGKKTLNINKLKDSSLQTEEIDKNDIEIIKLESDLGNMIKRTESYVIESVFIGALTFSGFLTIVSSDKVQENIENLKFIPDYIQNLLNQLIVFNWGGMVKSIDQIVNGLVLFSLIAIESLICSTFFVLVLASRTKFSNLIEKLDYLIKIAKLFNSKEEEFYLLKEQNVKGLEHRLQYLKDKTQISIVDAKSVFEKIRPIYYHMIAFRNLGIYTFYLILITSGFYFSYSTAILIAIALLIGHFTRFVFTQFNSNSIRRIVEKHRK